MPRITAHRGRLCAHDAENALGSIDATVAAGVTAIEVDLRTSRDGAIFLLHDDTLERCTDGEGNIAQAADSYLLGLRLTDGQAPIPTFAQLLAWMADHRQVTVMLDLKGADSAQVLEALAQRDVAQQAILLTFSETATDEAISIAHDATVSMLVTDAAVLLRSSSHKLAYYLPQNADLSLFRAAAETGRPIITDALMPVPGGSLDQIATTSGDAVYRQFCDSRAITYLVTDRPLAAQRAVGDAAR